MYAMNSLSFSYDMTSWQKITFCYATPIVIGLSLFIAFVVLIAQDWKDCPGYRYEYYAFYVTNSEAVLRGADAETKEIGPFTWERYKTNRNSAIKGHYGTRYYLKYSSEHSGEDLDPEKERLIVADIPLWEAASRNQIETNQLTAHGYRSPFIGITFEDLQEGYDDYLPCLALGVMPSDCDESHPFRPSKDDKLNWATFHESFPRCECEYPFLRQFIPEEFVKEKPFWNGVVRRKSCPEEVRASQIQDFCSPMEKEGDVLQVNLCWSARETDVSKADEDSTPCIAESSTGCTCTKEVLNIYYTVGKDVAPHWPEVARMQREMTIPLIRIEHYYDCTMSKKGIIAWTLFGLSMLCVVWVGIAWTKCKGNS